MSDALFPFTVAAYTWMGTGFPGEREYRKEHPVWLEFSKKRRRVAVPLPAEEGRVREELKKLEAESGTPLRIRIKVRDLFPIHDTRVSEAELPLLEQTVEQLQGMDPEEIRRLRETILDKKWKDEYRIEGIRRILESFSGWQERKMKTRIRRQERSEENRRPLSQHQAYSAAEDVPRTIPFPGSKR